MTQDPLVDLAHITDAAEAVGAQEFAEICALFADELPAYVEAACAPDPAEARRHLHSLAGAAVNCGAARLAGLARRMERGADLDPAGRNALRTAGEETRQWYAANLASAVGL